MSQIDFYCDMLFFFAKCAIAISSVTFMIGVRSVNELCHCPKSHFGYLKPMNLITVIKSHVSTLV